MIKVQLDGSPQVNERYVKCNTNEAALFVDQQCFGVGMCIRNSQGHFLKALTKWFKCYPIHH